MMGTDYRPEVLRLLVLTVLLGAGRTLLVKSCFDFGFYDPFVTTILLLLANALALPAFYLSRHCRRATQRG